MVATVSVALGVQGLLPLPLVVVMFGRDFLLITGSLAYRARTKKTGEAFFDVEVKLKKHN
jgi:cardiolipin synthase (CMP-forming)